MDTTTTPPSSSCAAIAVATSETVVGSHVLTIDGYTKTAAALAAGESVQSEPFRVGGHVWYIECYPRGEDDDDDGADDWVSVFLYLDRHGCGIHEEEVKATHSSPCWIVPEGQFCPTDRAMCRPSPSTMPHGALLNAARSTTPAVLMAELLGTGKDDACGSRHVRVDGVAPRVFKALLHFVYTGSVPDNDDGGDSRIAVARGLLAAADRYGMERLKMLCGDVLCSNVDATTAVETLQLAHKHGCLKLNRACVKFIRGNLDAFSMEKTK